MLGAASGRVRLVPYAKAWKELFEEEKRRLKKAVGRHVISIEHVGSTSIPDLIAKPILDSSGAYTGGLFNVPAFLIVMILTVVLVRGIRESARANTIMVIIKASSAMPSWPR